MLKKILLIEDEEVAREIFSRLFKVAWDISGGNVEFSVAPSIDKGLEIIERESIDMIMLDLTLAADGSDSSQAQTVEFIRERHCALPPIVVVTADNSTALRVECLNAGAVDFAWKNHVMAAPNFFLANLFNRYVRSQLPYVPSAKRD